MSEPTETELRRLAENAHSELLSRAIELLTDARVANAALQKTFDDAVLASRTRDEKLRGEIQKLTGEVQTLTGTVTSLKGNLIVVAASVEVLETDVKRINQSMDGLAHLAKTNFDMNASILEELTGAKGADRPSYVDRPTGPG